MNRPVFFSALAICTIAYCEPSCGANVVDIEFVPVGNPGNAPKTPPRESPVGSVAYDYDIGKYEVTAGQYSAFLNAVAKDDPHGLYNPAMGDPTFFNWGANIQQFGSSPNFTYSVAPDWANRPVNYVSFWDAARFANWLHNGQPAGPQGPGTTEDGAYHDLDNQTFFGRNAGAKFFIPTVDEWYKPAFHDKAAGQVAQYFEFPTGANSVLGNDVTEATNSGNNANVLINDFAIGSPYYRTVVGEFESSESSYGTFDQAGNVREWIESLAISSSFRQIRGWSFNDPSHNTTADVTSQNYPTLEESRVGFRVASNPAPNDRPTVTVDFDELSGMPDVPGSIVPDFARLTDQYATLGVRFQNTAVVELGSGLTVTPPNGIGGIAPDGSLSYGAENPQQIQFSFFVGNAPAVTDFVSIRGDLLFDFGDSSQRQTLSAFDLSGALVGSTTVFDGGGGAYAVRAPGIHTVKWSGVTLFNGQSGEVGLDHLQFTQPLAVPEPSAMLLAAGGIIAITAARRPTMPCYCRFPAPRCASASRRATR